MTLGIIAALPEEIADLLDQMKEHMVKHTIGRRDFYEGNLYGQHCIIVLARVGKVAASATCVTLIQSFNVKRIIFTGLAGSIAPNVNIGDIVIGTSFCQHDLDAYPFFPRYEVPLLGKTFFESDVQLNHALLHSAHEFLDPSINDNIHEIISRDAFKTFSLDNLRIHQGLILSGDQFVGHRITAADLISVFPEGLCTEMEGAAVAQVCYEYDIPFTVMRIISDKADHTAHTDFKRFLTEVARFISSQILIKFLQNLQNKV
ncbi:S-adenosylhomocysteine nucleosidase [Pelistega indica]|uniref:S-adenosylhomocysteine nucleosidase n=1 Tax=Pelistega indica TaxID=1414851 RepID=V8G962_9BURK|nr:5'-methylthioadenosine/adenosylhomocysteine nucleosidase [Pelistega indica]ETD72468.1 S-adenosylhomocysteine nucleosidase [Pelistega indica]